jgi:L-ascorbate metabolism protein UlaG (beta-lactamase superfamily)
MIGRFDALRTAAAALALVLLPLAQAWGAGSCHVVARGEPTLVPAAYMPPRLAEAELRLTFVGHATFLIESPGGVRIATDYNDYVRPEVVPDVATMNLAHSTHHSSNPDPAIKYVLRGWNPEGGPARHDLRVGDAHIRNVPTNIRDWAGGTDYGGNSIFVFETADLCIAHLGHLHHKLTPEHLADLGAIDVVLVPVDGSWTLRLDAMMEVLGEIKAPLMIPMHFFGPSTLERFLARAGEQGYEVARSDTPSIVLSRATLPSRPKVLVLPGY